MELLLTILRIKDTIEKTSIIRTKILVPTDVTNTFLTFERGKPLYCSKKQLKISGPKVSVIERFHCMYMEYFSLKILCHFIIINSSDCDLMILMQNLV